jgi:hypothetical protein
VNIFNTTSTLTNLKQWIKLVKFTVPTESTCWNFFWLSNWFSFFLNGFNFFYFSWSNILIWSFWFFIPNRFLRWLFVYMTGAWWYWIPVNLLCLLLFFLLVWRWKWISDFWTIENLFRMGEQREWFWLSNDWIYSNDLLNLIKILGLVYSIGIL